MIESIQIHLMNILAYSSLFVPLYIRLVIVTIHSIGPNLIISFLLTFSLILIISLDIHFLDYLLIILLFIHIIINNQTLVLIFNYTSFELVLLIQFPIFIIILIFLLFADRNGLCHHYSLVITSIPLQKYLIVVIIGADIILDLIPQLFIITVHIIILFIDPNLLSIHVSFFASIYTITHICLFHLIHQILIVSH